jgi:M6 family metalloprotease-like protein
MRFYGFLLTVMMMFFIHHTVWAVYQENVPKRVYQPDGTVLECFVSGDEFFNYLHDADGYTIIVGDDGFYYYAVRQNQKILASEFRADQYNAGQLGLEPKVVISPEEYNRRVEEFNRHLDKSVKAPLTGQMNNLVVFIRFSDDTEFTAPRLEFDQNFNAPEGPSVKHYFLEVSYQQLDIESHHFPLAPLNTNLSYQDPNPRAYYQPYHAVTNPLGYDPDIPFGNSTNPNGRTFRQHTLLVNAINFIQNQVPLDLVIDADNDGLVDNVSFIIRGEQGQWNNLLWAHRWALWSQVATIHGKRVWDFTFQPETQSSTYVLCHEMFHTLGAPDLYRYAQDGFNPVGPWDLMHAGFVHMGAYMKYRYANGQWVQELPVIAGTGTYTLEPLYNQSNNVYRIISPNSVEEYFVVEYRRRMGQYETNIPGEGLLIYRIYPQVSGNAQGPPDEVYIFRPGGTLTQNGNIFAANFSLQSGRIEFHDGSNPNGFLRDGNPAGIFIANVSLAGGETISFDLFPHSPGAYPPQDLIAEPTEGFNMLLQWNIPDQDNNGPTLTGYRIYRNFELVDQIDDPTATSYLDIAPPAGDHDYFMRAVYEDPDAVSYGTAIVTAFMPGFFEIEQGEQHVVEATAGVLQLDLSSNIPVWQAFSSATWAEVNPPSGGFSQPVDIVYSTNESNQPRTAEIAFTSAELDMQYIIEILQQGLPTYVEDLTMPFLEIFPNPVAGGYLSIKFNQDVAVGNILMYASDGSRVLDLMVNASGNENIKINTEGLNPGLYLLVTLINNQPFTHKVIIQ